MVFFTRKGRALLMAAAVAALAAVWLAGCGDGGGGGDGDGIEGDWLLYSESHGDGIYYPENEGYKSVFSFKSSGNFAVVNFEKLGSIWVESTESGMDEAKWRTSGSTLYITVPREGTGSVPYRISGDKLIISEQEVEWTCNDDGDCYEQSYDSEQTFTRCNLADVRRSLGTVYTTDSRLRSSPAYDDLMWYLQSDRSMILEFDGYNIWGEGVELYVDYWDPRYYTNDGKNKLYLVNKDCDWDANNVRHCTVSSPTILDYSLTGSGTGMRLTISGDVWLPIEYDDYYDYDYSPAGSKLSKRPSAGSKLRSVAGVFFPRSAPRSPRSAGR